MEKKQRVIMYGNTVALAGIEASLRLDPSIEVIGHVLPGNQKDLAALHPDVVIFDAGNVESEFLLAQLQSQNGLLLIGIDPETHEVLLTGQAVHSITLDQITRIMQSRERPHSEEAIPPPNAGNGPGRPTKLITKKIPTNFLQGESNEHKNDFT